MDEPKRNDITPRCHIPWQQMVIDSSGAVVPCCYWGAYGNSNPPVGNLSIQSIEEIWNGEGFQRLRDGMANGDLQAAGCDRCYALQQGLAMGFECDPDYEDDITTPYAQNMRTLRNEISAGATVLEAKPTIVSYTPSHRCNIRCTHCYQESTRTMEIDRAEADEEVARLAPYLTRLVAGGGEPFLLPIWREFLERFDLSVNPYLDFSTTTNATIITDRILNGLSRFKKVTINVSLDGTGAAYERVRIGAQFNQVATNIRRLKLVAGRSRSPTSTVGVTMCVMKSNILDLSRFLRFARDEELPCGISPVISMPPDENLRCFNDHPAREMAGWQDAIDAAEAELESYLPTLAAILPDQQLFEANVSVWHNAFRLLRSLMPFELARVLHHRVRIEMPADLMVQWHEQYGPELVAYIFRAGESTEGALYWAKIVDGILDVHLSRGSYVVNVGTKWAPAGYWDQVPFEVTDDCAETIRAKRVAPYGEECGEGMVAEEGLEPPTRGL
jgi:radical SAM protein with 4Fe4S-binding SPASM domain